MHVLIFPIYLVIIDINVCLVRILYFTQIFSLSVTERIFGELISNANLRIYKNVSCNNSSWQCQRSLVGKLFLVPMNTMPYEECYCDHYIAENVFRDINSLVPGRYGCNLKLVNFKLISRIHVLDIICQTRWRIINFGLDNGLRQQNKLFKIFSWNLCFAEIVVLGSSYENFKMKLCTCAQSMALGTRTKFQLEILSINVISGIVYFRGIILESSRNVSETTPWLYVDPDLWRHMVPLN